MSIPMLVANAQNSSNPFLNYWNGPYGGVPAFGEYKITDFKPALETAIQEKLNEINMISNNPKPATFENTIVALEKAGKKYTEVEVQCIKAPCSGLGICN